MEYFILSLNIMLPIIAIIALGYILKVKGIINDEYTKRTSAIIFNIALPILLFNKTANSNFNISLILELKNFLIYGTGAIVISYLISDIISKKTIKDLRTRGAFVQGCFRSNFIIIGYPILTKLGGEEIIIPMSLLAVFLVSLNGILSVTTLTVNNPDNKNINLNHIFFNVLRNPLILAIILGLVWSLLKIPIPMFIQGIFDIVQGMATPLALIAIGSMFVLETKAKINLPLVFSTLYKTILFPVAGTFVAVLLGFRGVYLAVIFISLATPTATTSFIMARAMDSDYNLAANIVVATTTVSSITIFIGIIILKTYGLI